MSRIFEALQQLSVDTGLGEDYAPTKARPQVLSTIGEAVDLDTVSCFSLPVRAESRLPTLSDPNSLAAEKYRALAAKLRQAQSRKGVKNVLTASAMRGDGKTVTSANLAITLASHGDKTLLIDGDLHKPSLHSLLGINQPQGFAEWAGESTSIVDYLHREQHMPLWFLPAGNCVEQPLSKIEAPATKDLLRQLRSWFDWIVIDSPPLIPLTDSSVWAGMCDAVLLLVREGVTPKGIFAKSVEALDKSKLFAVILNDAYTRESEYYGQYYSASTRRRLPHSEDS